MDPAEWKYTRGGYVVVMSLVKSYFFFCAFLNENIIRCCCRLALNKTLFPFRGVYLHQKNSWNEFLRDWNGSHWACFDNCCVDANFFFLLFRLRERWCAYENNKYWNSWVISGGNYFNFILAHTSITNGKKLKTKGKEKEERETESESKREEFSVCSVGFSVLMRCQPSISVSFRQYWRWHFHLLLMCLPKYPALLLKSLQTLQKIVDCLFIPFWWVFPTGIFITFAD